MPITKCKICGSKSKNLSKIWPEPESLTKLPLEEWQVNWWAERPVLDSCCVVCATVISVFFIAREDFDIPGENLRITQLKARTIAPSQRYLLTLDPLSAYMFDDMDDWTKAAIIINPLVNTCLGTYEPCGRLPVNSGSAEALGLARTWLDTCRVQHPECTIQVGHYVPTRLLNISHADPKLVLREEVETAQDDIKYVALSHCWGGSQPLKTLRSNIDPHRVGIPLKNLPATFKDAIKVVRSLGLRYIWIDSLCIVQDDSDDWVREAEQMGKVYGNAELVLAAAVASSANDGFLRDRPVIYGGRVSFKLNTEPDPIESDYRLVTHFIHQENSPLDGRAWTFQERLLAKRYLTYGNDELRWECLKESYCECGWVFTEQPGDNQKMNLDSMFELTPASDLIGLWNNIVWQYSQRGLTVRSDKLVAISSVASRFQSKYGGTYLAGLWKEDLIHGLLWDVSSNSNDPRSPENFYAPSWSWASINMDSTNGFSMPSKWEITLVDIMNASVTPSTTNSFGPVSSGTIQLRGKVIQSTFHINTSKYVKPWIKPFEIGIEWNNLFLDLPLVAYGSTLDHTTGKTITSARRISFTEKDSPQEVSATYSIWVLPLLATDRFVYGLVLGLSPKHPGRFERLGCGSFGHSSKKIGTLTKYILTKYKSQEITIV
ncbi:HET-domain-containing protein [Annulohypoxylon bovei var. microspora]|nr:HET-domain-containing protein [Annulohypoxylon bovei var. microspora]